MAGIKDDAPPVKYVVYTDGSCLDGYGGYAYIAYVNDAERRIGAGQADERTTANRMELTAFIEFLRDTEPGSEIVLYSDSTYVLTGLTCGRRQLNRDLWDKFYEFRKKFSITGKHVRAHKGHVIQSRVDKMARTMAERARKRLSTNGASGVVEGTAGSKKVVGKSRDPQGNKAT